MIEYPLAKELKDAGFPVKPWPTCDLLEPWDFYPPTLSELIEACGGLYFTLTKDAYGWTATVNNGEEDIGRGRGSTPEEAVARLRLALNKKEN